MVQELSHIWKAVRFVKLSFGLETFQSPKKAKVQKYVCKFLRATTVLLVLTTYCGYFTCHEPHEKIQVKIEIIGSSLTYFCMPIFIKKRELVDIGLLWCENLQRKYGRFQFFKTCKKDSTKVFQMFVYGIPLGSVFLLLSQSLYSYYCKIFLAPLGTVAPNAWSFVFISSTQYIGIYLLSLTFSISFSFIFTMQSHFSATFSYIKNVLAQLKPKMTDKQVRDIIKEAVDLHCEIIEYQILLEEFHYFIILIIEWVIYLLILLTWIVVFHMPTLIIFASGTLGYLLVYFIICWTNEKLDDAYDDVRDALYDLEWYEMPPKQRNMIQLVMVAYNRRRFVRAGPLHILNFEGFADMLNRIYSYGLIINDLVGALS